MAHIHPSAIVESSAKIADNVQIGPFSYIGPNVELAEGVCIKSHVCIEGDTYIGEGTTIWPQAVIGTKTQDLKFRGEKTRVLIGKGCDIRECVTINASCGEGTTVEIGDYCLIMAYCHVAHNCIVGNRVILGNAATLAGHVTIEDCAIISGLTGVHQFSRVGCYAMVGGMSRITHDVLPYSIGAGSPYRLGGINLVGLKRHGISLSVRKELVRAFKLIYRSGLPLSESVMSIQQNIAQIPEIRHIIQFCRSSKRGLIGMRGITASDAIQQAAAETELENEVTV